MKIGKTITELRKAKGWSQNDLASKIDIPQVMVGKYERDDATPSIDVAKRIADAFEVSLDYLVGEGQNASFDKKTLKRIQELDLLDDNKRNTLFDLIDTYIRDAKTSQAYAG